MGRSWNKLDSQAEVLSHKGISASCEEAGRLEVMSCKVSFFFSELPNLEFLWK